MESEIILFITTWFCLWCLGWILYGAYLCVEDAEERFKQAQIDKNTLNK